ncbi:MAG: copper chaperone PCu(A)C [Candidatus Nanopelagicales bacterium]
MRKIALVGIAVLALAGCSSSSGDTVTESTSPSPVMTASPAGAIEVADAYIMTNGDVAGMFAEVSNDGEQAVRLTGGSAANVGMVQIHEYIKEGTKEVMKEVPGGLEVPAGGTVELMPGSYHVMLMNVTADWQPGDEVMVTLDFDNGEQVQVEAEVQQREGMQ